MPYQPFETADVPLALAVGTDAQFRKLCAVIGQPELADDERYRTNQGRVINRGSLIPILQAALVQKTAGEWDSLLAVAKIPAGTIKTLDQVFDDPQTIALGIVQEIQHPTAQTVRVVGSPMHLSQTPTVIDRPPPLLGEHNHELLHELLGYGAEQIGQLEEQEVI